MLSAGAQAALNSMNLRELLFMMKEGKLFDENLSVSSLTKIFARASSAPLLHF